MAARQIIDRMLKGTLRDIAVGDMLAALECLRDDVMYLSSVRQRIEGRTFRCSDTRAFRVADDLAAIGRLLHLEVRSCHDGWRLVRRL